MKFNLQKSKLGRTRVFAIITTLAVVLAFGLNLLMTYIGRESSLYVDTTSEGLYTLTDAMKRECDFIDGLDSDDRCVKITFCADPDTLIASVETRVPYFMALKLASRYENLEVETVNVNYNPTAVAQYKATSLKNIGESDIIVSYGGRYRISNASRFWATSSGEVAAYNGEYRMATLIKSVTAVNRPVAYYVVDHGESYYDAENPESEMSLENAAFYDLLGDRGMDVKTLKLSELLEQGKEIPDDCVLLIINNPKHDLLVDESRLDELDYVSETELLDRYLVKRNGSIMVARDHDSTRRDPLPVFDAFLREWGFSFGDALVCDDENHIASIDGGYSDVVCELETDEETYAYTIYGTVSSVGTAPPFVLSDAGYIECSYPGTTSVPEDGTLSVNRDFASLLDTHEQSYATVTGADGMPSTVNRGKMTVAATTTRTYLDQITKEDKYSFLFCANSPEIFSSEAISNLSYANYDILSLLVDDMATIDSYASIELGGYSDNSPNKGGKMLTDTTLSSVNTADKAAFKTSTAISFAVVVMLVPVAVAVLGIIVSVRRKFL